MSNNDNKILYIFNPTCKSNFTFIQCHDSYPFLLDYFTELKISQDRIETISLTRWSLHNSKAFRFSRNWGNNLSEALTWSIFSIQHIIYTIVFIFINFIIICLLMCFLDLLHELHFFYFLLFYILSQNKTVYGTKCQCLVIQFSV